MECNKIVGLIKKDSYHPLTTAWIQTMMTLPVLRNAILHQKDKYLDEYKEVIKVYCGLKKGDRYSKINRIVDKVNKKIKEEVIGSLNDSMLIMEHMLDDTVIYMEDSYSDINISVLSDGESASNVLKVDINDNLNSNFAKIFEKNNDLEEFVKKYSKILIVKPINSADKYVYRNRIYNGKYELKSLVINEGSDNYSTVVRRETDTFYKVTNNKIELFSLPDDGLSNVIAAFYEWKD